jgi:nucleoside-diphosphate-sugar epimerase
MLVTGGARFIGHHLVKSLQQRIVEVLSLIILAMQMAFFTQDQDRDRDQKRNSE